MEEKILVIEDTPVNMELVTDLLEVAGYQVIQAETAETGIERAQAEHPDLILMDIGLPEMDGPEVLQHMQADENLKDLPVIALTAHAMAGDREKYLALGFNDYVTKPIVDEATLISTIERFLNKAAV